jgi:hypothetical protein
MRIRIQQLKLMRIRIRIRIRNPPQCHASNDKINLNKITCCESAAKQKDSVSATLAEAAQAYLPLFDWCKDDSEQRCRVPKTFEPKAENDIITEIYFYHVN